MPFKNWLQHYKLDLILPLFYETQTSQGYGYLEEVPAYYGRLPTHAALYTAPLLFLFHESCCPPVLLGCAIPCCALIWLSLCNVREALKL